MLMTDSIALKLHNELSKINEVVPHINQGGCASFAALLAEKLISLGYNAEITGIVGERDILNNLMGVPDADFVRNHFDETNKRVHQLNLNHKAPDYHTLVLCDHYCVRVDKYYFDSSNYSTLLENGSIQLKLNYTIIGPVNLEDTDYISLQNRGHIWNEAFSPSDIETIKEMISKITL